MTWRPMSSTIDICNTFKERAFSTWNLLRKSRVNGFQPGEETITDMNLLEIKHRHPREISLHKFTKRMEGLTGADWEWWLTGPSGSWLGFRIQAKVIALNSGQFPHLYYKNKSSSEYQTDVLINDALKRTPPRIPLYCLYSNWDTRSVPYQWSCGLFRRSARFYGCSFLSAFIVRRLRIRKTAPKLTSILPYMLPWQCLLCCTACGEGDLPQRAWHYWRGAIFAQEQIGFKDLDENVDEEIVEIYRRIELSTQPPSYVLQLLENVEPEELPDDPSLQGIIVVREGVTGRENRNF